MKGTITCDLFHISSKRIYIEAEVSLDGYVVLSKRLLMNSIEISIDEAIKIFMKNLYEVVPAFNVYISTAEGLKNIASWIFGISKNEIEEFGINPQTFFPTLLKKIWSDVVFIVSMNLVRKYKIDDLDVIVVFERDSIDSIEYIDNEEAILKEPKTVKSIKRYTVEHVPEIDSGEGDIYGKEIIEITFEDGTALSFEISGWDFEVKKIKDAVAKKLPRKSQIEHVIENYDKTIEELDSLF